MSFLQELQQSFDNFRQFNATAGIGSQSSTTARGSKSGGIIGTPMMPEVQPHMTSTGFSIGQNANAFTGFIPAAVESYEEP